MSTSTRPLEIAPETSAGTPAAVDDGLSPAGALVLRLVELRTVDGGDSRAVGGDFLARRALREVSGPGDDEREPLLRVIDALEGSGSDPSPAMDHALLLWAAFLEAHQKLDGARRVLETAMEVSSGDAELILHAARVSRKAGDAEGAHSLYLRVRRQEGPDRRLSLMADIGLALLSADAERRLGRVLRRAIRKNEMEVAAVAHEERAAVRRRKGDRAGALRDYAGACVRYRDPADRGRVIHSAADVLVAAADPLAARQVLLEIEALGLPGQWDRARSRLREISRSVGDELGVRRWKADGHRRLVSLAPSRQVPRERSRLPDVSRWIGRLRGANARAG